MADPALPDNGPMKPPWPAHPMRSMAVRFAINQVACTLIALVLWLFRHDTNFWTGWIFSMAIGNSCWLLIDAGLRVVARWVRRRRPGPEGWPGWPLAAPVVVAGSLVGYLGGHTLASTLLGLRPGLGLQHGPVIFLSVLAAMTISYLFYARERMLTQHLQTQAAERLASDMQLKLLQSQLEPHMLFNTLANLRVLIGLDAAQAQAMLDHLIAFLRTTLASTRVDRHALATEFKALDDYLALMRVRMGARLQPQFELPPPLAEVPVPPLLLQPLVENAIKHGLEPKVEGGRIEIGARRLGDRLQLRVRDTGIGLPAAGGAAAAGGFGLEQVRTRLATLYGERATLTVRPAADADGGAEVLVDMPLDSATP